jgi:hypothetical protein
MTLELSDLDTIKNNALKKFEERVGSARDNPGEIEREPEVSKTAELWDGFVKTCDLFAGRIYQLSQQYSLGTAAYDRVLDIRSAAEELRALHVP